MRSTIHTIVAQDRAHNQRIDSVCRYQDDEMAEVFSPAELDRLAQGLVVNRGAVRFVDATVLAAQALARSFGDY